MKQAEEALAKANRTRKAAATFRRKVRCLPRPDGYVQLAEALEAKRIPAAVGRLSLDHFLQSVRRVGPKRVPTLLGRAEVVAHRRDRVGELTLPERSRLAAVLREAGK